MSSSNGCGVMTVIASADSRPTAHTRVAQPHLFAAPDRLKIPTKSKKTFLLETLRDGFLSWFRVSSSNGCGVMTVIASADSRPTPYTRVARPHLFPAPDRLKIPTKSKKPFLLESLRNGFLSWFRVSSSNGCGDMTGSVENGTFASCWRIPQPLKT